MKNAAFLSRILSQVKESNRTGKLNWILWKLEPCPASIWRNGLKERLILRPLDNVVYLFLPLGVTSDELTDIAGRFRIVLERILNSC